MNAPHALLLAAFEAAVALPAGFVVFEEDVPGAGAILREWAKRCGYEVTTSTIEDSGYQGLQVLHCKPRQGCDIAIHLEAAHVEG